MVDPVAVRAFGSRAADYERGRPGWPGDAVTALLERFGAGTVVDLAAGTGKLTRVLAERAGTVIAIEPVDGMRDVLRERLPHVRAMNGAAESIPLPDASVDAVFVAEAFHWFDAVPAAAEIARVLKPGGGVAVLWNQPLLEGVAWADELYRTLSTHRSFVTPNRDSSQGWRDALASEPRFGELHDEAAEHEHETDRDGLLAEIASFSWVGGLAPDDFAATIADCRAVLERRDVDRVTIRYRTLITWAQAKRAGESRGSAG
jgi:SAM-dependent methyltransferase